MTSIHSANRYTFRWFIYVVSGEYEAVRIPAAILRSWNEHGWFIIVGAALIICQLEGHELAFCGTVQHRLLLQDIMDVLGSISNCWVIAIRFFTTFCK